MAEAVKEMPMAVAPNLEVVGTTSTEGHVPAGAFPGTAIEGGIEEIVVSTNSVETGLTAGGVASEEVTVISLDVPGTPFRKVTRGPLIARMRPQLSDADSAEELEKSLSNRLVSEVSNTAPDVKALCDTYGLKREELGRLTGFSLRALAEWSAGKLPSQPAKRRLQEIRRLLDALAEIVKTSAIPDWLHKPNPAFDQMTPLQVIEVGEIDRLWEMVHDLRSGQPE